MSELRVVTFKIDPQTVELLDLYAIRHRMSRSDAIREAINLLLKSEKVQKAKVEKIRL